MVARVFDCDRDRLRLLLAEELEEPQRGETQEHLESCRACRNSLELMAAETDWWDDATRFLNSDDVDPDPNATIALDVPDEPDVVGDFVLEYLEPSDDPSMLGRVGEYEISEIVGRGGMGVVVKGYDGELNRYVAIKLLAPHFASSAAARKRFAREAQAAAAVVHQHVVAIHNVEGSAKLPYLVMPFVAGESLQQRIDAAGPLELDDILRIGLQAAEGLAAAHAQGLVHRDVKPANILLEKGVERVLLSDFGLARAADDASLTCSGVIAGTPQYMSPEQAHGETIDHRSDLFSLGSVLYTMCTGHPPFRAESTMGILRRITDDAPRCVRDANPTVPIWLAAIIEKLHAKNPSQRFQSAAELAELLGQCLAHVQHPTTEPLPASLPTSRQSTRRRTIVLSSLGAACVVAAVLAAAALSHNRDLNEEDVLSEPAPVAAPSDDPNEPPAAADSDELDWNNDAAQSLLEVEREVNQLEDRARRLFDDGHLSAPESNDPNTTE